MAPFRARGRSNCAGVRRAPRWAWVVALAWCQLTQTTWVGLQFHNLVVVVLSSIFPTKESFLFFAQVILTHSPWNRLFKICFPTLKLFYFNKKWYLKIVAGAGPVAEWKVRTLRFSGPRFCWFGSWARTRHRSSGHAKAVSHMRQLKIHNSVPGGFGEKKEK